MSGKAVITGMGVIAAIGIGREAFAAALREGRSGIGDLVSFDSSASGRERAAEIQNFSPEPYLRSPKNYLDRNSALAFAASEMAVRESGAKLPDIERGCGVSLGTMAGNMDSLVSFYAKLREKGPRLAPPFLFPHTYYNTTAGLLSIEYGLSGAHGQFCSGGAAGLEAVAFAAEAIERGRAPLMLAGGVEAFSEPLFRVALANGWLSPLDGGEESCTPFSPDRNGAILGEGAAVFVLESETMADKSKCVISGYGIGHTALEAMHTAIERALIQPSDIGGVFAAGGGYSDADKEEDAALHDVFTAEMPRIVALKSLLGETLGASGPLSLAAAELTLQNELVPPGALPGKPLNQILVNAGPPTEGLWVSIILSRQS